MWQNWYLWQPTLPLMRMPELSFLGTVRLPCVTTLLSQIVVHQFSNSSLFCNCGNDWSPLAAQVFLTLMPMPEPLSFETLRAPLWDQLTLTASSSLSTNVQRAAIVAKLVPLSQNLASRRPNPSIHTAYSRASVSGNLGAPLWNSLTATSSMFPTALF